MRTSPNVPRYRVVLIRLVTACFVGIGTSLLAALAWDVVDGNDLDRSTMWFAMAMLLVGGLCQGIAYLLGDEQRPQTTAGSAAAAAEFSAEELNQICRVNLSVHPRWQKQWRKSTLSLTLLHGLLACTFGAGSLWFSYKAREFLSSKFGDEFTPSSVSWRRAPDELRLSCPLQVQATWVEQGIQSERIFVRCDHAHLETTAPPPTFRRLFGRSDWVSCSWTAPNAREGVAFLLMPFAALTFLVAMPWVLRQQLAQRRMVYECATTERSWHWCAVEREPQQMYGIDMGRVALHVAHPHTGDRFTHAVRSDETLHFEGQHILCACSPANASFCIPVSASSGPWVLSEQQLAAAKEWARRANNFG